MNAQGVAVDLAQRKTTFTADGKTTTTKAVLTEAEAAQYTIQNVLSGNDSWNADAEGEILSIPTLRIDGNQMTWSDNTGKAACYLVCISGVITLTTEESSVITPDSEVSVRCVSANGVLGRCANRYTATGISTPTKDNKGTTPIYNLQGQRLLHPHKGINIQNGRKYVVGKRD